MLRARILAGAILISALAADPARPTPGTIRMPERSCPDLSQNLSYGRGHGGAVSDGKGGYRTLFIENPRAKGQPWEIPPPVTDGLRRANAP
jgi:hypothetical protein